MKLYYSLRIEVKVDQFELVNNILGIKSNNPSFWEVQYEQTFDEEYCSYIKHFINILENKYNQLLSINIHREDISIWILYEYENQCNLEFNPDELKRIGEEGITLCISCWEAG